MPQNRVSDTTVHVILNTINGVHHLSHLVFVTIQSYNQENLIMFSYVWITSWTFFSKNQTLEEDVIALCNSKY